MQIKRAIKVKFYLSVTRKFLPLRTIECNQHELLASVKKAPFLQSKLDDHNNRITIYSIHKIWVLQQNWLTDITDDWNCKSHKKQTGVQSDSNIKCKWKPKCNSGAFTYILKCFRIFSCCNALCTISFDLVDTLNEFYSV